MPQKALFRIGATIFAVGILGLLLPDLIIMIVKATPSVFGDLSKELASRDLTKTMWLTSLSDFFNDYGSWLGVAGALIGSLGMLGASEQKGPEPLA